MAYCEDMKESEIKRSDETIKRAIEILNSTDRGRKTLRDLKTFLNPNQQGLDQAGITAALALFTEFFLVHRRGFLDKVEGEIKPTTKLELVRGYDKKFVPVEDVDPNQ